MKNMSITQTPSLVDTVVCQETQLEPQGKGEAWST